MCREKKPNVNAKMNLHSNIVQSVQTLMTQIDTAVAYGSDATRGQGLTSRPGGCLPPEATLELL